MITGLYASAASLLGAEKQVDLISSNLANCSTPAYKQSRFTYSSFPDILFRSVGRNEGPRALGKVGSGALPDKLSTCFKPGDVQRTGNILDLAIDGDGFFQVLTDQGVRYTRNGSFHRDIQGVIRDASDNPVLGRSGNIRVQSPDFLINERGEIIVQTTTDGIVKNEIVDRIDVVDFQDKSLLCRSGGCLFEMPKGAGRQTKESTASIKQYSLEESNMTAVDGMIQMITAFRAYESSAKMLETIDETTRKTVTEVANASA